MRIGIELQDLFLLSRDRIGTQTTLLPVVLVPVSHGKCLLTYQLYFYLNNIRYNDITDMATLVNS